MKTVSGHVVSSKPISLSKATKTLSSFVATDTGASQTIAAYLRRTLASFKELKQLHNELKATRKLERKRKRDKSSNATEGESSPMSVLQYPFSSTEPTQILSEEPKSQVLSEEPKSQVLSEEPKSQVLSEEPKSQVLSEEPKHKKRRK